MAMSQQLSPMLGTRTEVRSRRGAVSAGHPLAVQAGLAALADGGNAIDAAVAAAFAAFVAEPNNAGIGGYGHLSAYVQSQRRFLTVDHGPRAPKAASADMYEVIGEDAVDGHDWPAVAGDRNTVGHLAPAVPGAVAGLWSAHQEAGRLPWARLLEPAIALATEGLEVTWPLLLEIVARVEEIRTYATLMAILLPSSRLPKARTADGPGERLNQRDLAATLWLIAQHGPEAFYTGAVAEGIVAAVAAGGGILSTADLADYRPKCFDETPERYRAFEYVTSHDTVGYEALGILERFPLGTYGPGSAEHYHLLAEAMGHAFAEGATYANDPDFTDDPIAALGSPAFAAARAAGISVERAAPRPVAPAAPWRSDHTGMRSAGGVHGTTQVVAADADGNLVSLITTIGADFGSLVAVPGTGIVLNNSMVNYDPRPGRSNSIAPGKMPFFAVPAIVAARDGAPAFAAAGSGGYPILAGVINTVVGIADHGLSVQTAIDEPRVHSQGNRTFIDTRVDPIVRDRLADLGHELVVQDVTPGELAFSRVSAIAVGEDGVISAGAGPAWTTAAGGL
jgi:gamma-glutamyltranspeptidase / glutathione hydrolase